MLDARPKSVFIFARGPKPAVRRCSRETKACPYQSVNIHPIIVCGTPSETFDPIVASIANKAMRYSRT